MNNKRLLFFCECVGVSNNLEDASSDAENNQMVQKQSRLKAVTYLKNILSCTVFVLFVQFTNLNVYFN